MRDGSQRGMKEIFIVWGHHAAIVMGVVMFPVLAINSDVLKTVHHAPVIQTVKQTIQLPRESTQRRDSHIVFNTCYGLIKVYSTYHQPTAASGKAHQGRQDRR
jgi:hypothetical protein